MATVTKPIALDESFNTTEVTPRNIADVLAEGLSHITGRTASEVEYDNTDSGLTSDDVQGAIDELSERPTLPSVDIQTAVDEFETYNGGLLSECKVALSPNQDLHGYSEPWVGGANKNKLPLVLADIKTDNTAGTWSGNKYTNNGVEWEIVTDEDGNVTEIVANNLATGNSVLYIKRKPQLEENTNYILNGCPANGSNSTYRMAYSNQVNQDYSDTGNGVTFQKFDYVTYPNSAVFCVVYNGYTANNIKFKPMARLATESDPTFAPYTNICPISGHTQVEVENEGKNLISGIENGAVDDYGSPSTSAYRCRAVEFIHIKPNTQYTLKALSDDGTLEYLVRTFEDADGSYRISDNDGWHQGAFTFTSQVNAHDLKVIFRFSNNASIDASQIYNVQLELGSTATDYVPYNGYQVTVNLGGTYYSGTLDVVSGVLVPDTASVDLGTLTWSKGSVSYYAPISGMKIQTNQSQKMNAYCSSYKISAQSEQKYNTISGLNWGAYIAFWNLVDYSDANQVKTAMSGVQLVYELATPTPIQLSPTMVKALVGENHLSAPLEGQEITESKYRELFTWDEVEAYVNAHSGGGSGMNYSTEEQVVGTWIDGKPLYQKTIDCDALPNNTAKNITTPSNLKYLVNAYGFAYSPADITYQRLVPFSAGGTNDIRVDLESGNVRIVTYSNWSSYNAFLTLQYTKTTD